jgi:receptor-type tyrosine-protein phosphatase gamma
VLLCALKETDKVFIRRACSRCRRQSPDDYYIINLLLFVCLNYLFIYFLFFKDISSLSYQTVVVRAGQNVNISCPGVNELSLVSDLEWRCQGCGGYNKTSSNNNNKDQGNDSTSSSSAVKLVEYGGNSEAVVVWHNSDRLSLDSQTYALVFNPVRHYDHGEYTCLVNERRRPDAIIHLVVQGTLPFLLLPPPSPPLNPL